MSLKFSIWQSKDNSSVKAISVAREVDKDTAANFVKIDQVGFEGSATNTLNALLAMQNAQGESFRETLEGLVAEAYKQGQDSADTPAPNLRWPPGHD